MKTKRLVTTSMLIALATILSMIIVFALPFGGSITAASMVPIVLVGYLYGIRWGVFSAFVYSLIQMLVGMGTVSAFFLPGDSQMPLFSALCICIIDYVLAYSCLGLSGIFKGRFKNDILSFILGAFVVCVMRYLMHIVSGAIFFGAWAEWFFSDSTGLMGIPFMSKFCNYIMTTFRSGGLGVIYSVIYNGAYMIPETIITVVFAPVIYKIVEKSKGK